MAKPLYSPFPFHRYIRLLSITPSSEDSNEIQCSLEPARLDHPPTFDALSYVWGDQDSVLEIKCNNQPVRVSKNLHAALQMIRRRTAQRAEKAHRNVVGQALRKLGHRNEETSFIWIDKLCIDQSNLDERCDQVKLMRQIYSSARDVLIWLGPADEGSSALGMSMIRRAAAYWKRCYNSNPYLRLPDLSDLSTRGIKKSLRLPELESSDWGALQEVFSRPWFSRIWVVQEATVASNAILIVGDLEISWQTVSDAGAFVRHIQPLFKHPYREFEGLEISHIMYTLRDEIEHDRLSLVDLLRHTRHFGATDPRDKIFALLGLTVEGRHPSGSGLDPNYKATMLDVYRDATISIIQKTGSLEILSHAVCPESDDVDGFPSWVPRWDQPKLGQSWSSQFSEKYCTSANFSVQYYPAADRNSLTFTADGLSFDTVKSISEILWSPLFDISPAVFRKIDNPIWKIWANMARPLQNYPTGESITQAFVITFLAGLSASGTNHNLRTTRYLVSHMKYWMRLIKQSHNLHSVMSSIGTEMMGVDEADLMLTERRNDLQHDPSHFYSSGVDWKNDAVFQNPETRFFTTRRGYMGVGVRQLKIGDKVCVLFGNKVPIILRPIGNEYKLVGECYTHGIMKGEFVTRWQNENFRRLQRDQWAQNCERFVIR